MTREAVRKRALSLVKKNLKAKKTQIVEGFYLHKDYGEREAAVSGGLRSTLSDPELERGVVHRRGNND